jgi:hypothetical protein
VIEQQFARFPQSPMSIGTIGHDAVALPYGKAETAETSLQLLLSYLNDSNVEISLTGSAAGVALLGLLKKG